MIYSKTNANRILYESKLRIFKFVFKIRSVNVRRGGNRQPSLNLHLVYIAGYLQNHLAETMQKSEKLTVCAKGMLPNLEIPDVLSIHQNHGKLTL